MNEELGMKETQKIKRILLTVFFMLVFIFPVFSQVGAQPAQQAQQAQPWWYSLEQGKLKFRAQDYSGALILFEDARRHRRAVFEQMERDFIHLLSLNEVRRLGDALDFVERYSYNHHYLAASAALEELYYRVPKLSLNNSASAALAAFDKLKDYPEAEYWIGEIYRVEGELSIALAQFRKAYALRDLFEDQGFGTVLLYKISGVLKTRQDYNEMEKTYLSIINELDTLWINAGKAEISGKENVGTDGKPLPVPYAQASASFASQAMTQTLEKYGINRFLEMYRYDNNLVEEAHRLLGFYYAVSGRISAQQHLMFAFLIQNTTIINEIQRRKFDFKFSQLSDLTEEINRNALLLSYIQEVEYYKTTYYLAASLYRNGKSAVARELWTFLASQPQADEWYGRAAGQLRNPHLEPVVEMP